MTGGERKKLQVAHITLSQSRAFLVRAQRLPPNDELFDADWRRFRVFGGVRGRGICDRLETAFDCVCRSKERQVNIRLLALTNHDVVAPEFCNPAAGWEKGHIQKTVQDARPGMWKLMPYFPDLSAMNIWLEQHCYEMWRATVLGTLPEAIAEGWGAEQSAL